MIGEFVRYPAPEGADRADIVLDARSVVPKWRAEPDLIRKHFMRSDDGKWLSGFYLWKNREAAEAAHNAEWREAVRERTGALPETTYFDAFMILDNEAGEVSEY